MDDTRALPDGACDCHTHVIGQTSDYSMMSDRAYTPGPASVDALRAHLQGVGLTRVVIVQPSVYGTDNRCLLDSLIQMNGAARGVAVVDADVSSAELRDMHDAGVRGLRLNLESTGERDTTSVRPFLASMASRIAPLGWHLQLYAALDSVIELTDTLAHLDAPVVLDHFALVPSELQRDDEGAQRLLALLRGGNAYVKLSAPYRLGNDCNITARRWARTFIESASSQVVWGSDWPHTAREPGLSAHQVSRYRDISRLELIDSIYTWLPTPEDRHRVLVVNPQVLYGFE